MAIGDAFLVLSIALATLFVLAGVVGVVDSFTVITKPFELLDKLKFTVIILAGCVLIGLGSFLWWLILLFIFA